MVAFIECLDKTCQIARRKGMIEASMEAAACVTSVSILAQVQTQKPSKCGGPGMA